MRNSWKIISVAFTLAVGSLAMPATAATLGMVADNVTHSVTVFDADTGTVLGSVTIPPTGDIGDCSVSADQTRGFVTDFASHVWVIDLTTITLAGPPNPIPISNFGEDTSISHDQKFLCTCDGSAVQAVSVIDIATQTQIGTFALGTDCNSVDICSDGSVLVTSSITGNVRRLTISGTGVLTDTGEVMASGGMPNNAFCAPGGTSGVVVTRGTHHIKSFTIPGLVPVDTRTLSGAFSGISGQINPLGDRVFVRSNVGTDASSPGFVDVFTYNSVTGSLGAAPLFSISIAGTPTFFGMDQMALHPNGTKLYVSQPSAVKVFDAGTGAPLPPITNPSIVGPTGVAFGATSREVTALSDAHLWIGLKNSDDQGTQFDLKTELLKNGTPVASGLERCITGVTRNPSLAKEAIVPWNSFSPEPVASGDVLSLRVSTRIGTNPDDTKCTPGHNNAVGLRLYYDSTSRPSRFDMTITPDASKDFYLHSDGNPCANAESTGVTTRYLDNTPPTATNAKCKDSSTVNFNGGNPFSLIGTWSLAPLP